MSLTTSAIRKSRTTTARFGPRAEPPAAHTSARTPGKPLLMRRWKYLWPNEYVEMRLGPKTIGTGWIDEATADGSTLWIHLSRGQGRRMIHHSDGIDVWRMDSCLPPNMADV
ncbi:hypothetical protein AB0P28_14950 [Pseudarthrobacter sp. NPDC089323]